MSTAIQLRRKCRWHWRGRAASLRLHDTTFVARAFACRSHDLHIGLVVYLGNVQRTSRDVTVRIHSGCVTGDVFRSGDCDCAWQLDDAIERVLKARCGVIVYLPWQEARGHGLAAKLASLRLIVTRNIDTVEAFRRLRLKQDIRQYDAATWILRRLGVRRVALISNNPAKTGALREAGFPVRVALSIMPCPNAAVTRNMLAKRRSLGHIERTSP